MNERTWNRLALIVMTGICLSLMTWWFVHNPVSDYIEAAPGRDNRPADFVSRGPEVQIGALFASFDGIPSELQSSWPRFRGRDFDNISKETVSLADSWSSAGPPLIWSVDLGEGHAGPAVAGGRVYVLDYDEEKRADILRCLSLEDGREIWQRGYEVFIKRNHGMSRTVPAVSEGFVVTMGPLCQVMCVDAESGGFLWGLDLELDFEAEVPLWYTGQCPLIDGTTAVLGVGGRSLLIGVDCATGEIVWEVPNPDGWTMSHSSVILTSLYGRRLYLYSAIGGIVGVSAEPESAGEVLFSSTAWSNNVIAPSPVPLGDGRIFVTAGYGAGSRMLRVNQGAGGWTVEFLQALKPEEGLASEQQTPIYYKNHLFAILPKDAGPLRNEFVCVSPEDCSKIVWSSGTTNRFGLGPFIVADDKFFILSDDGVLTIADADPEEYRQLARVKILDGVDAWGPMALVEGRLLARDSRRLVCVDVRAGS